MLTVATLPATAGSPNVRTSSPVIHLADNLDEADGLGWCIDTVGRGLSNRLHAHSCKPRGGDVQFRHDMVTGQIVSMPYDTKCAISAGVSETLGLVDCDPESEAQKFTYAAGDQTIHPSSENGLCLVVGETSTSAGPYMSRALLLAPCAETDLARKTWIVLP